MLTTVENVRPADAAPFCVEGHVDPSTGNIDVPGDLHVRGNVVDGFQVNCGGNAQIDGVIEAAVVQAGADLLAIGGISGKEKGQCRAEGSIRARYVANATIESGADVLVQTEISHSRVICGGDLRIES